MQYWHEAGDAYIEEGTGTLIVPDRSGVGRHLSAGISFQPSVSQNSINARPAISWSGSQNPLSFTGALLVKHLFIIASHTDATFSANHAGLIGPLTGALGILSGNASDTKFYNMGWGANYTYRRRDVVFAESNQQATMSGAFSIYEVRHLTGFSMDGILVGRDRDFANRKWKGKVAESLGYNRILTDGEVTDIYEAFALKYLLWRQVASSFLNVWPFPADWGRPLPSDKPILASTAVSGAHKERVKSSAKLAVAPQFEGRDAEEYDAARVFWNEHYGVKNFIYRDYAFATPRDYTMRFASGLTPVAADSFHKHNYAFQALEP